MIHSPPPRLYGRNLLIATIDIWKLDFVQKSKEVIDMRNAWDKHTERDHIFKWFWTDELTARCELALNWLKDTKNISFLDLPSTNGSYQKLLMVFDRATTNYSEKELWIKAIKGRWAQNKYRKKEEGKKQVNLMLSSNAISKLDELAKKYDLSRAKVLEILIQFEEQRNSYIPEKMKLINLDVFKSIGVDQNSTSK